MRGQRSFKEIIREPGLGASVPKGRSNKLINRRNECLLERYYYYGSFKHQCYEEILRQLVSEFFLSPSTIATIIQTHTEELQVIKHRAQVLYYFRTGGRI